MLGLVRRMAEAERGWFRQVFLGEHLPDLYDRAADEDADFNDIDQATRRRRSMPSTRVRRVATGGRASREP